MGDAENSWKSTWRLTVYGKMIYEGIVISVGLDATDSIIFTGGSYKCKFIDQPND